MEWIAILLFVLVFVLILAGYPVAFTLAGLSILVGALTVPDFFMLLPFRIMGIMQNYVLLAVPLFVFMGLMLEKSGLAANLLESMSILFGKINGGLAISVIIVGALLAASTGIVGATVITMGLISLPTMLKRKYKPSLATGVIASSGTLGQIIPPSVVLVLLGSVLNVSVGKLFAAAIIPGMILVGAYIIYVLVVARLRPDIAPPVPQEEIDKYKSEDFYIKTVKAFVMPLLLITAVLGSIFYGIASPTEAAAVGALGAIILALIQRKLTFDVLKDVAQETTHLTSMVFMILLGATTFSLVFRGLEGDRFLVDLIQGSSIGPTGFLLIVMLVIFIAGFFIDFIEIIFIIVPVVTPVFIELDMNLIWIGILIALNLQTSFLTPPFGFALFYLKSVAPSEVSTLDIYKGVIPFLILQIILVLVVLLWPGILML
ncbi:TRAP transporter large permease [Portibacter lacus]|uniref:C4-dicarboxylate ABC transporter n=1 Tax=Portibacter lacus TaxID=1099794 RepID=A0AA37SPQ9_9BACT|nr:TRAP transporter large permease subunit [Portibacter lacus]GLR16458.1 C4-dicarboxylate ABC transporter [Portibacter lacus]